MFISNLDIIVAEDRLLHQIPEKRRLGKDELGKYLKLPYLEEFTFVRLNGGGIQEGPIHGSVLLIFAYSGREGTK